MQASRSNPRRRTESHALRNVADLLREAAQTGASARLSILFEDRTAASVKFYEGRIVSVRYLRMEPLEALEAVLRKSALAVHRRDLDSPRRRRPHRTPYRVEPPVETAVHTYAAR